MAHIFGIPHINKRAFKKMNVPFVLCCANIQICSNIPDVIYIQSQEFINGRKEMDVKSIHSKHHQIRT